MNNRLFLFANIFMFVCASACTTYRRGKGTLTAESVEGEYQVYSNEIFASPDKKDLKADIFVPQTLKPSSGFPAVLLIHGGGWTNGSKEQMTPIAERLVKAGFAVMNISYRFAPKHLWPSQMDDCQSALRWFKSKSQRFQIDTNRIAAFGYSAGAHLALMLAYASSDPDLQVNAVVDGAGPVDFKDFPDSPLVRQLMGESIENIPDAYRNASPYNFVSKNSPPTFVYYGENDWIVDAKQNQKLLAALKKNGIKHDSYEAYFGHIATFLFDEKETGLAINFLTKVFKDAH